VNRSAASHMTVADQADLLAFEEATQGKPPQK